MDDPFQDSPDCPICGAAHSTCAPAGWHPDEHEIWTGDTVPLNTSGTVLVPWDVVHEVPGVYPGQSHTSILWGKGARITPEQARECGLLPVESDAGPVLEVKT